MTDRPAPRLRRRSLLFGGAGAASALALGAGFLWSPLAQADTPGGVFDLDKGAEKFLREKALHHTTVLQSFAFDNTNKHLYVLQVTGDELAGNLVLTKLDYTGAKLGYMTLKGFGHGVAMGVELDGSTPWIWTETDNNTDSGYGRAVTRFKFANAKTLTYGSGSLPVYRAHAGSTSNTPSIDARNGRIAIRYRSGSTMNYKVFKLADFKNQRFSPLHTFTQTGIDDGEVFQGWCLHGDYIYQLTGTAYTAESGANPPSGKGNTHLSCVDVRTGKLVERRRTEAAYSLDYREPEGIAVQLTSTPRLHMGFASGAKGARRFSLYFKPQ
jgi:hypothetical protein